MHDKHGYGGQFQELPGVRPSRDLGKDNASCSVWGKRRRVAGKSGLTTSTLADKRSAALGTPLVWDGRVEAEEGRTGGAGAPQLLHKISW